MKEILIDKVIGSDFWETGIVAKDIQAKLDEAKNEKQIRIVIDSPGGDVFEAVGICGVIKNFARENPQIKIDTYIRGLAASAASFISQMAKLGNKKNKVFCESSSVFMIHRAWGTQTGNCNDMLWRAERQAKIDECIQVPVFCEVTGKNADEILQKLDEETYFFGQEIVDYGFADEVLSSDKKPDKTEKTFALENAKNKFCAMAKKPKEFDEEKFVALVGEFGFSNKKGKNNGLSPVASNNGKSKEKKMTLEELKQNEPEIFNALINMGVEKERARVKAHFDKGEKYSCLDVAIGFIKDGSLASDEAVLDKYLEGGVAAKAVSDRKDENQGNLNPPNDEQNKMSEKFAQALNPGGYFYARN